MQKIKNGSLLIAHPTLIDDTFFKSIILITHHNNDESIGLVINNPSKIKLHEIIDNLPKSDFPLILLLEFFQRLFFEALVPILLLKYHI